MPRNIQTIAHLHSSHTLPKEFSKFSKLGLNSMKTENFQVFKLDLEKQRNHTSNCQHPLGHRKAREFKKNIYFCFIDYAKAFDCVTHNKLWKILQEMEIPDHLNCLLRNLYAGQEATVNTIGGTMDWFQIGKGVHQGCISSPCLFNLHVVYIMRNARLDEAQAEIKISGRNINNLRYADDTTLMAENKEELKSLLLKVKEENEKLIQKTKIMASGPITSWEIDGKTMEIVTDFIFLGSKITTDYDCSHEIKRHLFLGRKAMTNLDSILKSRDIINKSLSSQSYSFSSSHVWM
uniref:RNA-directed DNA polymerase n=1 Tax=Bos indicus x Bos taurus TaxID=30522 RepID=A0A4W2GUQ6_BOBOX